MFGFAALCVAGLAFGVRSMKKRSTRTYQPAPADLEAAVALESGSRDLLSEEQLE